GTAEPPVWQSWNAKSASASPCTACATKVAGAGNVMAMVCPSSPSGLPTLWSGMSMPHAVRASATRAPQATSKALWDGLGRTLRDVWPALAREGASLGVGRGEEGSFEDIANLQPSGSPSFGVLAHVSGALGAARVESALTCTACFANARWHQPSAARRLAKVAYLRCCRRGRLVPDVRSRPLGHSQ